MTDFYFLKDVNDYLLKQKTVCMCNYHTRPYLRTATKLADQNELETSQVSEEAEREQGNRSKTLFKRIIFFLYPVACWR